MLSWYHVPVVRNNFFAGPVSKCNDETEEVDDEAVVEGYCHGGMWAVEGGNCYGMERIGPEFGGDEEVRMASMSWVLRVVGSYVETFKKSCWAADQIESSTWWCVPGVPDLNSKGLPASLSPTSSSRNACHSGIPPTSLGVQSSTKVFVPDDTLGSSLQLLELSLLSSLPDVYNYYVSTTNNEPVSRHQTQQNPRLATADRF